MKTLIIFDDSYYDILLLRLVKELKLVDFLKRTDHAQN